MHVWKWPSYVSAYFMSYWNWCEISLHTSASLSSQLENCYEFPVLVFHISDCFIQDPPSSHIFSKWFFINNSWNYVIRCSSKLVLKRGTPHGIIYDNWRWTYDYVGKTFLKLNIYFTHSHVPSYFFLSMYLLSAWHFFWCSSVFCVVACMELELHITRTQIFVKNILRFLYAHVCNKFRLF
jgi:hypothetical protein